MKRKEMDEQDQRLDELCDACFQALTFDSEDDIPEECTQPAICIETINMFLKYIEEYKEKLFQGKEQWKP